MNKDLKMYIGTYSDKTITDILTKQYREKYNYILSTEEEQEKYDKEMNEFISQKLTNGVSWDITYFFAKDLSESKRIAKSMGLKNFSQICDTVYEIK